MRVPTSLLGYATMIAVSGVAATLAAAPSQQIGLEPSGLSVRPLDTLTVVGAQHGTLVVSDGEGREYLRTDAAPRVGFRVGGSLGVHRVKLLDGAGKVSEQISFSVDAETLIDDDTGRFKELYELARTTLVPGAAGLGSDGSDRGGHVVVRWRKRDFKLFVPWVLDQAETSKGAAFLSPHARDAVELFGHAQKSDGMIWSFVEPDPGRAGYWDTAYGHLGYVWHDGEALFVRQPVENHVEYQYVNMLYHAWKASGDDPFMQGSLETATRALDYSLQSPVRFSKRFGLLKRPYTIDSWDFQVDDAYLVREGLSPVLTIHPEKTKFGVFFGDNTGYIQACERLAELLERAGRASDAERFRKRGRELAERLTKLAWNGHFFRHFIEEDPGVRRDLAVDEKSQLAQANAYSLNRGIPHAQAIAILQTYQELRARLPRGSPGEWYAIYPPFGRGFGGPDERWQYMNGGVSGHAAGELARGAFEHGFERYGASILERALALAKRTDRKIHFAYTGAFPAAAKQTFRVVSLAKLANMDTTAPSNGRPWMEAEGGNDLARLPTGELRVHNVPFQLIDPRENQRRAVIAVAAARDLPRAVEIPLPRGRAGALYLLHTMNSGSESPNEVAAGIVFRYEDGSERGSYLRRGTHITGWWYPELATPSAGVAWRGPNAKTGDVGLVWTALANPEPQKAVRSIVVTASLEGGVYALFGLTLADRMPTPVPSPISHGGPDNWAASTMLLALVEGLGGVLDTDRAFRRARVSPRWAESSAARARVVARYGASSGYVAYEFVHDRAARKLDLTLTGSSEAFRARVLLPRAASLDGAVLDGREVKAQVTLVEASRYAELDVPAGIHTLTIRYRTP